MERIPLGFTGLDVLPGSHIAYTFHSEEDRQDKLCGYLTAGLQNNEKCIAAVSEYTAGYWKDGLRSKGINPDAISRDQLEILTARDLMPEDTSNLVQSIAQALGNSIDSTLTRQPKGIRICTSFTHLYQHKGMLVDLLTADSSLGHYAADNPITVLCTFSPKRLHPRLLHTALMCHQFITDGTTLEPNNSYIEHARLIGNLPNLLKELTIAGALVRPFILLDFHDGVPVLRIGDEMDVYTSPELENMAAWLESMGHRRLIVDLSDTTFMDAASISTIMRIAVEMGKKQGEIVIHDPSDPPRKVFELIQMSERIPIVTNLKEATRRFERRTSNIQRPT